MPTVQNFRRRSLSGWGKWGVISEGFWPSLYLWCLPKYCTQVPCFTLVLFFDYQLKMSCQGYETFILFYAPWSGRKFSAGPSSTPSKYLHIYFPYKTLAHEFPAECPSHSPWLGHVIDTHLLNFKIFEERDDILFVFVSLALSSGPYTR